MKDDDAPCPQVAGEDGEEVVTVNVVESSDGGVVHHVRSDRFPPSDIRIHPFGFSSFGAASHTQFDFSTAPFFGKKKWRV